MLVIKDAMILIHLSKIGLLEKACNFLGTVVIPKKVYNEMIKAGRKRNYPAAVLIGEIIEKGDIEVKKVSEDNLIKKAKSFNIQGGEAEAVALYWEENADLLATDDDNVRRKKELLNLSLIGTPVIILKLYENKVLKKSKFKRALEELKEIGWFSNAVIDQVRLNGDQDA